ARRCPLLAADPRGRPAAAGSTRPLAHHGASRKGLAELAAPAFRHDLIAPPTTRRHLPSPTTTPAFVRNGTPVLGRDDGPSRHRTDARAGGRGLPLDPAPLGFR